MLLTAGLEVCLGVSTGIPPHYKSTGDPKGLSFWSLKQKQAATANEGGGVLMQSREEEEKHLWGFGPLWTGS